ncbi:hypothetical protein NW855_16565 [Synechococcus sp. RC10B2]|uniref:hypothetical protein n=1 Tax=Synechococcus sp. RC10B2 TaxID=2964530 RepID=UPI0039C6859D
MNALGRLLAVGSEWGGYATLVPTGGARKAARAPADEASEQLGRQGARQASRELKPVVIGENMERVRAYARRIGAETIDDWLAGRKWTLELNEAWIRQMMREGRRVIDIGPDFARRADTGKVSQVYGLERRLLKGYPYYERQFLRWRKLRGGNPDVDIHEAWYYILDEF